MSCSIRKIVSFLSHVAAMRVGQALMIKNSDPVGHNTKISSKKNPPFNQIIPQGGTTLYKPTKAENSGPVPVSCSIHPWMSSFLLIHENGYLAVSKDDGSFEIPNLPAGVELEFRVWQEKLGFFNDIEIAGQPVKKGRFVMTLNAADPSANVLDVRISSSAF